MRSLLLAAIVCAMCALAGCNNSTGKDKSGASGASGSSNSSGAGNMSGSATTQPSDSASPTTAPATQASASAKPVNTICPICNEKVDPALTTTYQGKVIGFGCASCPDEFKKNPEKYVSNLK